MQYCLNCNVNTSNPKFCCRSCAASYNNRLKPKRKPESTCKSCGDSVITQHVFCKRCRKDLYKGDCSLSEVRYDKHHRSSSRALVRSRARALMKKNKPYKCVVCGYDKHCEVAHIKSISEFPETTLISEVNNLDNLIYLCQNHHWELDHQLLSL